MQMLCDMLSLYFANVYRFDYNIYDDGVGVCDEDGGFGWEVVVCVCKICFGDAPNLSKVLCEPVVESVISVDISESFILVGIGVY